MLDAITHLFRESSKLAACIIYLTEPEELVLYVCRSRVRNHIDGKQCLGVKRAEDACKAKAQRGWISSSYLLLGKIPHLSSLPEKSHNLSPKPLPMSHLPSRSIQTEPETAQPKTHHHHQVPVSSPQPTIYPSALTSPSNPPPPLSPPPPNPHHPPPPPTTLKIKHHAIQPLMPRVLTTRGPRPPHVLVGPRGPQHPRLDVRARHRRAVLVRQQRAQVAAPALAQVVRVVGGRRVGDGFGGARVRVREVEGLWLPGRGGVS